MGQTAIMISGGMIFTLICVALLVISLHQNKFRLLNGILCNLALLSFGVTVILAIEATEIGWLNTLLLVVLAVIGFPILVLYSLLGVLLLWNAVTVWHKESHTLGNMLTAIIPLWLSNEIQ